jgi:hypothetical protein
VTIKRGTIDLDEHTDETDDERTAREDREAQAQRDEDKRVRDLEIEAARLKGENDALTRGIKDTPPPAAAALSDAQWAELEQAHGKTKQQILADAQLTRATAEEVARPLREMLAEVRKEATEAKDEARRAKAGTSLYAVEKDFFDKNPGLAGHRGDIDAFLAKFPEDMRSDPSKLKDLLSDAKTYVRGKVREERLRDGGRERDGQRRTQTDRPEFNDDPETDDSVKLDFAGLDNEGSQRLIEQIARRPGGEDLSEAPPAMDEVSIDKAYKLSERSDGRGVSIDERGEFARGRQKSERALRDGDRVRLSEEERDRRPARR